MTPHEALDIITRYMDENRMHSSAKCLDVECTCEVRQADEAVAVIRTAAATKDHLRQDLEVAICGLADMGNARDLTLSGIRKKAQWLYAELRSRNP
jgi:hypothetical protein